MKLYSNFVCTILSATTFCLFAVSGYSAAAPAAPAKAAAKVPAVATTPVTPAPAAAVPAKASAEDSKAASPVTTTVSTNPNLDPVLKKALDEIKWKYDVSPDGTCRIRLSLGRERSHQVFVKSKRDSFMGTDFRRIYATAMKSKDLPSADIMAKLLQDSSLKKLGAWEILRWTDGYRVILSAKIPTDCSSTTLQATIRFVLFGADEMEDQLTGKDEF